MPRYRVVRRDSICVLREALPRVSRAAAVDTVRYLLTGRYTWYDYRGYLRGGPHGYPPNAEWFVIQEEDP